MTVSMFRATALLGLLALAAPARAQEEPPAENLPAAEIVDAEVLDAADSPEVPVDLAEPAASEESPSESVAEPPPARGAVFEYIETVTIIGAGAEVSVSSSCLVEVVADGANVRVRVSPGADRPRSREGDPEPGKITLADSSGQSLAQWDIRPRAADFLFVPDERGSLRIEGLGRAAAAEAFAVLSQQAGENVVQPGGRSRYRVSLKGDGRPIVLEGEQVAGDLWVDWSITGAAMLEVEGRGWEIPLSFTLPETAVGRAKALLSAEANMRYSSSRAGAEDETKVSASISVDSRGEKYSYSRKGELRPLALEVAETGDRRIAIDPGSAMGASASALVRSAALATLGTQHLAGIRDTGLAVWLAQAAIDTDAARVAASAGRQASRALSTLDKLSPRLETPEFLERREIKDGALLRLDVNQSFVVAKGWIDGPGDGYFSESTALMVPDIAFAVRWRMRDRWRLGFGGRARITRWDTDNPRVSWYMGGGGLRAEYMGDSLRLGADIAYGAIGYSMSSSVRNASGTFAAPMVGGDLEVQLSKKTSIALNFWMPVGQEEAAVHALVADIKLNRYLTDYVALHVGASHSEFRDGEATGGAVEFSGDGIGFGVTMRW